MKYVHLYGFLYWLTAMIATFLFTKLVKINENVCYLLKQIVFVL